MIVEKPEKQIQNKKLSHLFTNERHPIDSQINFSFIAATTKTNRT